MSSKLYGKLSIACFFLSFPVSYLSGLIFSGGGDFTGSHFVAALGVTFIGIVTIGFILGYIGSSLNVPSENTPKGGLWLNGIVLFILGVGIFSSFF